MAIGIGQESFHNAWLIVPQESCKHSEAHVDRQSYPNSLKAVVTCKGDYADDADNSHKNLRKNWTKFVRTKKWKNRAQLEEQKVVDLPLNKQHIQNLMLHNWHHQKQKPKRWLVEWERQTEPKKKNFL